MSHISNVTLMKVPLENDYAHTLYFADEQSQRAYFNSRLKKVYADFSYQRKDNVIRIPDIYDNLVGYNYVSYKNNNSNKTYYAFITDMKYVNDGMTEVYIETDVIQTWLFDYRIRESFIEREHAADDGIGVNTIDEGLNLGDYICKKHTKANYGGGNYKIVVGVTETSDGVQHGGVMCNGVWSGLRYFAFSDRSTGLTALDTFINAYDKGKAEAIKCIFLAPASMITTNDDHSVKYTTETDKHYINTSAAGSINTNIAFTDNLDGYNPKNKKLLCFPYRYLLVSNNNGGNAIYHHEEFYMQMQLGQRKNIITPSFRIQGCVTPGCSVRMVPTNYKGEASNDEEGLNLGKFPILNWTSDYYTNWLTQNGVNMAISGVASVGSIVGGAAAMLSAPVTAGLGGIAGAGMLVSGVMGAANSLAEMRKASLVPAQSSGNINCGDVITVSGENDFHFYEMSIKEEYARIIDGYFNCYGYKVNRFGVPYLLHRENYWYTKTIGANIDGNIPQKDLQIIKNCYNNGITFWRNAENIGDYTVSNEITVE